MWQKGLKVNCKMPSKPKPSNLAMRLGLIKKRYTTENFLSFSLDKAYMGKVDRNKTEHLPSL